jgi:AcrR family transcriptional regulator
MSQSSYHHGNLREALLERAVEVLGEAGVEGLSLRGLSRDLGVSHAAPARHFSSKGELLSAIAKEGYRRMTAAALTAAEGKSSAVERLRAMGRASVQWAMRNRAFYSAIMNPDVNRYGDEGLKTSLQDYLAVVRAAFEAAQAEGWQPKHKLQALQIFGMATTIGASIIFSDYLQSNLFGELTDEKLIDEIIDLVIPPL